MFGSSLLPAVTYTSDGAACAASFPFHLESSSNAGAHAAHASSERRVSRQRCINRINSGAPGGLWHLVTEPYCTAGPGEAHTPAVEGDGGVLSADSFHHLA